MEEVPVNEQTNHFRAQSSSKEDCPWLDSLSEDWNSHPGSFESPRSLNTPSPGPTFKSQPGNKCSRIPRFKPKEPLNTHNGLKALEGRESMTKDYLFNMTPTSNPTTKLQCPQMEKSTTHTRALSASTDSTDSISSVKRHKIIHELRKHSSTDDLHFTPEWRRRLAIDDFSIDKRDLFSGPGLEGIFKSPLLNSNSHTQKSDEDHKNIGIKSLSKSQVDFEQENTKPGSTQTDKKSYSEETDKQKFRTLGATSDIIKSNQLCVHSTNSNENKLKHASKYLSSEKNSAPIFTEPQVNGSDYRTERNFSGQSISINEQLSQIILEKQSIGDGQFHFAPANLASYQIPQKLDRIREETLEDSPNKQGHKFHGTTSQSLKIIPKNPTEKPFKNFPSLGDFRQSTSLKSPLSLSDESTILPEESLQASTPKEILNRSNTYANSNSDLKQCLSKTTERQIKSLNRKVKKGSDNTPRSPLKIFGTHDTFTNEKLLSRVSQFEYELKDRDGSLTPTYSGNRLMNCELNKKTGGLKNIEKTNIFENTQIQEERKSNGIDLRDPNKINYKKQVDCDQNEIELYQKDKENRRSSHDSDSKSAFKTSPYAPVLNNYSITCRQNSNSAEDNSLNETSNNSRVKPKLHVAPSPSGVNCSLRQKDQQRTPINKNSYLEGKRLPKTPLRHPDAKRRRTLQTTDFNKKLTLNSGTNFESLREAHYKMHTVTHRDRKGLATDTSQPTETPETLSIPSILSDKFNKAIQQNSPDIGNKSPPVSIENTIDNNADFIPTQLYWEEIRRAQLINGSISQTQTNSSKSSFPSEDFIETAKKIMSGLREKARTHTASISAKQFNPDDFPNGSFQRDSLESRSDELYQESTQELLSRPPSRDGSKPVPRIPRQQQNPVLLEHLRKYYENDDLDAIIASSLKSISNAKRNSEIAKQINRITEEKVMKASVRRFSSPNQVISSCSPVCKVSEISDDKKDNDSTSAVPYLTMAENGNDFLSLRSNVSSGQSTTCSMPSGSSRGSDYRRVIVPKSVSHLIPEQLAGMVFDHGLKKWVKEKTNGENVHTNIFVSEDTEDDPFGDIPDLSVDETLERERIQAISEKQAEGSNLLDTCNGQETRSKLVPNIIPKINYNSEDSNEEMSSCSLSASSKLSEKPLQKISLMKIFGSSSKKDSKTVNVKNFEPQGSILQPINTPSLSKTGEDFLQAKEKVSHPDFSLQNRNSKQRNITISFSSPIASFIETEEYDNQINLYHDHGHGHASSPCDILGKDELSNKLSSKENHCSQTITTAKHISSRKFYQKSSLGGHHPPPRPVSRIEERDEEISRFHDENENSKNLSIILTTTTTSNPAKIPEAYNTPIPIREIGNLTLTPLSEFTAHQADESFGLDVSYLVQNHQSAAENTKNTLSLSIKDLVRKITEVEPFEPYWEHLKEISLREKCLKSVHKLDEFCERLMDLDISDNQISTLDGVPRTVQNLNISNNILSDMTAWSHLINLQYVDVSNNSLESLSSLRCLVHMRSLRADKNKISSLEGIDQLEGLLSLRLRDNSVQKINFHDSKLQLLTDLDLRNNQISKIENIQCLRTLTKLDLVDNNLSEFSVDNSESLESIKYLKLSGNNLKSIDVSNFPNLRVLYLDRNQLGRLTGLMKAKYLDSLSLREQRDSTIDQGIFSEAFEVRKLFLSGNLLTKLDIVSHFLNLQYIELANCGLESLPHNFGTMFANVRVLNLNFNALTDIYPLKGILRLKRLHLAGNRLLGLDNLTKVISELPTLSSVDLRSNPITMGFYSPILEREVAFHARMDLDESKCQEPYKMAKMNKSKDTLYTSCLDMRTRMKRRIYEMFLIRSTPRLKTLDGLTVDRSVLYKNDDVYRSMVEAGFIAPYHINENSSSTKVGVDTKEESRENLNDEPWYAEDSFG